MKPAILILLRHFLPGYKAGGALRMIANVVEEMGDDLDFRIITSDRDIGDAEPYRNVVVGAWNSVGNAQVLYVSARHQTFAGLAAVIRDTPHQVLYINSYFDPLFSIAPLLCRSIGLLPRRPRFWRLAESSPMDAQPRAGCVSEKGTPGRRKRPGFWRRQPQHAGDVSGSLTLTC